MIKYVAVLALAAVTLAQDFDNFAQSPLSLPPRPAPAKARPAYQQQQQAPRAPPVAILKQIDRHNEDGSYTYGYESADGSFKIETKAPDGQIKGKYGYTDDTGKIRVVEYGASSIGFEPVGEGITVPPPTLVDETTDKYGNYLPEYSGEDPENPDPAPARTNYGNQQQARPQQQSNRAPVLQQSSTGFEYTAPSFQSAPAPRPQAAVPQFNFNEAARAAFAPARPAATGPSRPALIPGAQPAPINEPRGIDSYSRPSPALNFQPAQQQPLQYSAAPRIAQPVIRPIASAPRPAAPAYRPSGGFGGGLGGGSILDQLSKDFALPAGGNNVLDISFGVGR